MRMMQERQRGLYEPAMTETEHLILGHLESHRGRENPIAARELAAMVRLSERDLRRRIKRLIETGHLIGSTAGGEHHGYFIPVEPGDVAAALAPMIAMVLALARGGAVTRQGSAAAN